MNFALNGQDRAKVWERAKFKGEVKVMRGQSEPSDMRDM
jgi:hypothetical protein